jgi:Na+-transporting NADH:ubiquinone oxidoreductase subunit F
MVVTLVLVIALLYAKAKLTASGRVSIDINGGEKVLTVEQGGTLLSTLGENGIFLPSACGGGGSCGMCRCQVLEGGGDILPTEVNFFTRREQAAKWRLGCQVKVKADMKIHVEEAVLGVRKWECEVVSNRNVATFIKEFVVKLPEGERLDFRSGGYIQIDVPKYEGIKFADFDVQPEFRPDWDHNKMWGLVARNPEPTFRAYSMANHPAEGNIIMLNIRIATPPWDRAAGAFQGVNPGICSSYIFSLKPGDKITISGPYGEFFVRDTPNEKMFIGGGAGMAPMRSHIFDQFLTKKTDKPVTFWYGARSKREIFYQEQFEAIETDFPNFKFSIGLSEPRPEDNWTGYTGFIHNVIYDNYLKDHPAPEDIEYYLCGPPMMTAAITKMLDDLGVPPDNIMYDNFGA